MISSNKRAVVVGAGLAGVTSAYFLCKAGFAVTLIDEKPAPARGSSHKNGAQLSYAYCDALSSPSLLAQLPGIMLKRDPAYRCTVQADPDFLIWGLRFLANATDVRFTRNTLSLSRMALRSHSLLLDLLKEHPLSFVYRVNGKMLLYPTRKSCHKHKKMLEKKTQLGLSLSVLSREQATEIEPALSHYSDNIESVVFSPDDAVGHPDLFCSELVNVLKQTHGMKTLFGCKVEQINSSKNRICGISFRDSDPIECDLLLMATGQSSRLLPVKDRLYGDMWPVQGYSFTTDMQKGAMQVSITDTKRKMVFAPLGNALRVAGLADIGKQAFQFNPDRFNTLFQNAESAFPAIINSESAASRVAWSGARYVTPSSRPVIRKGSLQGLYLNMGHGTLGWTLSLGAAEKLLSIINT